MIERWSDIYTDASGALVCADGASGFESEAQKKAYENHRRSFGNIDSFNKIWYGGAPERLAELERSFLETERLRNRVSELEGQLTIAEEYIDIVEERSRLG